MQLNQTTLHLTDFWRKAHVRLPRFDWNDMVENTLESPTWVHFGAGNIFRGFIARLQQAPPGTGGGRVAGNGFFGVHSRI